MENVEKVRKKSKNFSKKFFSRKKKCPFLLPGEVLSEKKIFLARILTVIFRPVLAQKKLGIFSEGLDFDGKSMKINEKSMKINENQ